MGASGCGKTHYVRREFIKDGRKSYIVNGDPKDFSSKHSSKFIIQTFAESYKFNYKNVNILFDDVTSPTPASQAHIRRMITVTSRHNSCNVVVNAHSLTGNNIPQGTTGQFSEVIFCHDPRNEHNFTTFCTRHTTLEQDERTDVWESFMANNPPFSYLLYNQPQQSFRVISNESKREKSEKGKSKRSADSKKPNVPELRRQAGKFLPQSSKIASLQLFDYLAARDSSVLERVSLNSDMEIKTRKGDRAHFLDLLHTVSQQGQPVTDQIAAVFAEIQKSVNIPMCLIRNSLILQSLLNTKTK